MVIALSLVARRKPKEIPSLIRERLFIVREIYMNLKSFSDL